MPVSRKSRELIVAIAGFGPGGAMCARAMTVLDRNRDWKVVILEKESDVRGIHSPVSTAASNRGLGKL